MQLGLATCRAAGLAEAEARDAVRLAALISTRFASPFEFKDEYEAGEKAISNSGFGLNDSVFSSVNRIRNLTVCRSDVT